MLKKENGAIEKKNHSYTVWNGDYCHEHFWSGNKR